MGLGAAEAASDSQSIQTSQCRQAARDGQASGRSGSGATWLTR